MGAVDTTYTFTATDTITSAKMNNIIDQTTITTDAIIGTTLDVASGKLKVRSQGITSNELATESVTENSIVSLNVTSGKLADLSVIEAKIASSAVTSTKIADGSISQTKLASGVAPTGPAFRAYASSATLVTNNSFTKVTLGTEDFDTNNNFASSRFTPTVAGYYQVNGCVSFSSKETIQAIIYKNGAAWAAGSVANGQGTRSHVSDLVYLDGVSDYIELYAYQNSPAAANTTTGSSNTYFSGCLIRSA
jgi:hypothetical protein